MVLHAWYADFPSAHAVLVRVDGVDEAEVAVELVALSILRSFKLRGFEPFQGCSPELGTKCLKFDWFVPQTGPQFSRV